MTVPSLVHVADLEVRVGEPIAVGETSDGLRWVIPILGGEIRGRRVSGTILPAGADYQLIRPNGFTTLDARYVARVGDGGLLYILNTGVRYGPPEIMARMTRGEHVDPGEVYFRTTPRFETGSPEYEWMAHPLFVASGERYPDRVEMRIFEVA